MEERMRILERIEAGEISAGKGARQIEALLAGGAETETPAVVRHPLHPSHIWECGAGYGMGHSGAGPP